MLFMIKKQMRRFANGLWNLFVNGFFTLLPLCATIGIFSFSFSLIKSLLSPILTLDIPYIHKIPHGEILSVLIITLLAGLFLKSFIIRSCLDFFESFLTHIPLVRPIYSSIKQLTDAFLPGDNPKFKKIVLVEFPRKGMYSIGFLTSELAPELTQKLAHTQSLHSIFVPMTPNPTSGFFIACAEEDFFEISLTMQEAMTLIMSGGIIQPERFTKAN